MCVYMRACDRMKNPFSVAGARLGRERGERVASARRRDAQGVSLAVRFYFSHEQRAFEIVMRTSPHAPLRKEREETEREDGRGGSGGLGRGRKRERREADRAG